MCKREYIQLAMTVLAVSLTLAGCGGGGGSSDGNTSPVAANDLYTTNESTQLVVGNPGVLNNDSDPDGDSITAKIEQPPQNGTLTLFPNGSFNYTPNGGGGLTDSFSYTAWDGKVTSSPATVSIAINVAPTSNAGVNQTVNFGVVVTLNGSGSSDPNTSDTLTYLWEQIGGGNVTLSSTTSSSPTFTAPSTGPQTLSFRLTVTDGGGLEDTDTVDVVINVPPTASNKCSPIAVGAALPGDLNNQVSDPDSTNGEHSFTETVSPASGVLSLLSDGTFTYTPNSGFRGQDEFEYEVSDANGATDSGRIRIVVGKTRIMPLGDSITLGVKPGESSSPPEDPESNNGGYRIGLYNRLIGVSGKTYEFDFVGTQTDGGASPTFLADPDHEAFGGFRAYEIADGFDSSKHVVGHRGTSYSGVQDALTANPADVVLLHIGTNKINDTSGTEDDWTNTIVDLERILNEIDTWEIANSTPITVFLAQIIERADGVGSFPNSNIATLNTDISNLVGSRTTDRLVLVNQHDALTSDPVSAGYMGADGVHPTSSGYDKMGETWFSALESWGEILSCPDSF